MKTFDTHAHLCDERFDPDREALIASLPAKGLALCINVACEADEFAASAQLTARYPFLYGAYGIHPHVASKPGENWEAKLRCALADKKAVALGEIGLDYHYDFSERTDQKAVFIRQIELARELNFPVQLHIREAFGDSLEILRAHRDGLRGEMHCYSGSVETARECLELGLYIALGGAVTFENARRLLEVAAYIPDDRLLVETDCPYLTPVPLRGRRNDPSNIPHILTRLAELRKQTVAHVAQITLENGMRLFGIPSFGDAEKHLGA